MMSAILNTFRSPFTFHFLLFCSLLVEFVFEANIKTASLNKCDMERSGTNQTIFKFPCCSLSASPNPQSV